MKINNLQSILTQDHLCTEAPIYCVYSKEEICVDSDFDYDKIIYVNGESELGYLEFENLEAAWEEATSFDTKDESSMPKNPCSGEDFDPDDWEKRYIKFIDKFENAFFIRQNAENYIANNSHRFQDAYIYVESAYRNSEWQAIRELLIAAAEKEKNQLKFGLKYEDIVDGMFVIYSELPISNCANSLKRIWKTDRGWKEQTLASEWEGKYQETIDYQWWACDFIHIWDEKCYAPVEYDKNILPVDFMNKVLPLTIKGEQDLDKV